MKHLWHLSYKTMKTLKLKYNDIVNWCWAFGDPVSREDFIRFLSMCIDEMAEQDLNQKDTQRLTDLKECLPIAQNEDFTIFVDFRSGEEYEPEYASFNYIGDKVTTKYHYRP